MSRIGKKPITVPDGVTVKIEGNLVTVKGPKGELSRKFRPEIKIELDGNTLTVTRPDDMRQNRAFHGLTRALIQNMVTGVKEEYSRILDIVGVGYRAEMKDKNLLLNIGYSHPVYFIPPEGIKFQTPTQTQIVVSGVDKQLVGLVASKIRSLRKPEPYKGKGIKYKDEQIRRKAGKTAGK
ncbi:MAG: 50S ribosomal protein L6 [Ignavibacteriaceae bacterium]